VHSQGRLGRVQRLRLQLHGVLSPDRHRVLVPGCLLLRVLVLWQVLVLGRLPSGPLLLLLVPVLRRLPVGGCTGGIPKGARGLA